MSDRIDADLEVLESPGAILKAARESTNISVEEMAEQLNWLTSYVLAIEKDQYDAFSNQTFAKGYLKSYARRLAVEEQGLIESYEKIVGRESRELRETVETNIPTLHKSGAGKYIGLTVFWLVIVALWLARSSGDAGQDKVVIGKASSATENKVLLAKQEQLVEEESVGLEGLESVGLAPENLPQGVAGTLEGDQDGSQDSAVEELVKDVAEVAAQLEEDVEYSESSISEVMPAMPAEEVLHFSFSDECWLEVRDANGGLIYADLRRGGDKISISGIPPFDILAGQVTAVELRYKNELVALQADSGRNSVRMRIGE